MDLKPYFTVAVLHREAVCSRVWLSTGVHFLIRFQSVAMSSAAHAELRQNAGEKNHGLVQTNRLSLAAGGCPCGSGGAVHSRGHHQMALPFHK